MATRSLMNGAMNCREHSLSVFCTLSLLIFAAGAMTGCVFRRGGSAESPCLETRFEPFAQPGTRVCGALATGERIHWEISDICKDVGTRDLPSESEEAAKPGRPFPEITYYEQVPKSVEAIRALGPVSEGDVLYIRNMTTGRLTVVDTVLTCLDVALQELPDEYEWPLDKGCAFDGPRGLLCESCLNQLGLRCCIANIQAHHRYVRSQLDRTPVEPAYLGNHCELYLRAATLVRAVHSHISLLRILLEEPAAGHGVLKAARSHLLFSTQSESQAERHSRQLQVIKRKLLVSDQYD